MVFNSVDRPFYRCTNRICGLMDPRQISSEESIITSFLCYWTRMLMSFTSLHRDQSTYFLGISVSGCFPNRAASKTIPDRDIAQNHLVCNKPHSTTQPKWCIKQTLNEQAAQKVRKNRMAERERLAWTVSHDNGRRVNVREDESSSSRF